MDLQMEKAFSIEGKIAVVTGGAGFLGSHFALTLARNGARVAILDQKEVEYDQEGLNFIKQGQILSFLCNVTSKNEVQETANKIMSYWGVPHILINNAALDSPPDAPAEENGPFEAYPEASLDRVIGVNLKGTFFCCQVFGGKMAELGRGSVINLSSVYGLVSPNQNFYAYKREKEAAWIKPASYSLTKAAILQLTRYLATYWAKQGVRVNALTPAAVENGQDEGFVKSYIQHTPIGRLSHMSEVQAALLFLTSDASSYMTGANLMLDGGFTAW